ncbi:MAG TPA: hypothetical protein VGO93_11365 [Candidatus Xenobia bacterium]|jgi:hypothetical protein
MAIQGMALNSAQEVPVLRFAVRMLLVVFLCVLSRGVALAGATSSNLPPVDIGCVHTPVNKQGGFNWITVQADQLGPQCPRNPNAGNIFMEIEVNPICGAVGQVFVRPGVLPICGGFHPNTDGTTANAGFVKLCTEPCPFCIAFRGPSGDTAMTFSAWDWRPCRDVPNGEFLVGPLAPDTIPNIFGSNLPVSVGDPVTFTINPANPAPEVDTKDIRFPAAIVLIMLLLTRRSTG